LIAGFFLKEFPLLWERAGERGAERLPTACQSAAPPTLTLPHKGRGTSVEMAVYKAPLRDMRFVLDEVFNGNRVLAVRAGHE
jgi:hypothetical protein